MAKGDRTGNRKTREQRRTIKVPELGYYLIVTDTEGTERCFFAGLHQSLPEEVRNKLVIKVVETKTRSMPILVQCRQFKIHGHAALSSGEYMRARRDRSIPRQMKRCMEKFAVWEMR